MKQVEVTNKLSSLIHDMRDLEKAERTGMNAYYVRMEEVARAQSGFSQVLRDSQLEGESDSINPLCAAIVTLGEYAELLNELQLVRERDYHEFSLTPITDDND